MSMRVSSQLLYNSGINGISRLQTSLYNLQNQASTGRKIVTPQDDPVGAAQALVVTQSSQVNELYLKNQSDADSKLSLLDSTLGGVGDELQNIYERAVAAGNGAYSAADRAAIATELQEKLSNLQALANTQDGMGRFVFAGFQSTTKPFTVSANTAQTSDTSVTFLYVEPANPPYKTPYSEGGASTPANSYMSYSGDDGAQILQVSSSQYMKTNATGSEVFMSVQNSSGGATGQSIFDAVQNMIVNLQAARPAITIPTTDPNYATAVTENAQYTQALNDQYAQALGDIGAAIENVSRIRASVGGRLTALQTMTNTGEDRALQYSTQLSNLEDLDYAKALTQVSQQKLQLEAAQSTYTTTAQLSLFNYL